MVYRKKEANDWRRRVALQRHEQSREKIFLVARELFTQSGYKEVSVEQIAQRAGVAPATVYNRFGNKAAMAAALFEDAARALQKAAEKDIANGEPTESAVHRHFQRLAALTTANRTLVSALFQAVTDYALTTAQPVSAPDPRRITPLPGPLATILESSQVRGLRPKKIQAAHAAAMMTNAFLIRFLKGDDPKTAARECADLLLYGICGTNAR